MIRALRILILVVTGLLITTVAFGAGMAVSGLAPDPRPAAARAVAPIYPQNVPQKLMLLGEIWQVLQDNYVEPALLDDGDRLGRGAIDGLLEALADPHTAFLDRENYRLEQTDLRGSFEGIGATVNVQNNALTVVSPIAGSPAEAAGIRRGDRIVAVDGEPTTGMTLQEAVNRIRGPRGSKVRLTIQHANESQTVTLEIVRDEIKTASVVSRILEGDIGYLQIAFISSRTDDEVQDELRELQRQGAKRLVIDLRRNPGGLLQETVTVASQFVQGPILYEVDRQGQERTFRSGSGGLALNIPLAVLVDQTSASGAEVIAGAIQDAGRGPLIGERTFGKGSVNNVRELSDGSALYVTVARWLTPKRRAIEGVGLSPDIEVTVPADEVLTDDPVLARAVKYLQEQATPTTWALPRAEPAAPRTPVFSPAFSLLRDLLAARLTVRL